MLFFWEKQKPYYLLKEKFDIVGFFLYIRYGERGLRKRPKKYFKFEIGLRSIGMDVTTPEGESS